MNEKKIIKVISALIINLFLMLPLYSQFSGLETLSNYNCSWTSVLPGSPISQPQATSYGFCLVTDARNIMGYSSTGKLLWEKNIGRVRNLSLTALRGDFILFYDSNQSLLRLFNPSGSEIWSKALDFKLNSNPFPGRDGRFFLKGEDKLMCLGINGSIRWTIKTKAQKKTGLQELPDGSIVIFLEDENGKTKGLRVSPFGEKLEDITFAGSVKEAFTCSQGILLIFTDNSAGLFSLEKGLTQSRWVTSVKAGNPSFIVKEDGSDFRLLSLDSSGITIYKVNEADGSEENRWKIDGLNGNDILKSDFSGSGIFLADSRHAILMDDQCRELWSANMPVNLKNQKDIKLLYLQDNYLVFFDKNWSINAYLTYQETKKNVLKNIQSDYSSFIKLDLSEYNYYSQAGFFSQLKNPDREKEIKAGNFGEKEEKWLQETLSLARLYSLDSSSSDFGVHIESSIFKKDSAGFEAILQQLALLCTDQTQAACADIISKSSNKSYCRSLLTNLTGYDPDGKLLSAIERNAENAGNKDSSYCRILCDSVYSICFFMGRPAYNKLGKDILKRFMGPAYSSTTRTYARDILKKIISLEL